MWILLLILFPYAAGLFLIWPSNLFKERMPKGWKIFCWVIYAPIGLSFVVLKMFLYVWFIAIVVSPDAWEPCVTRENVSAPEYRTAKDFYKLTGVEFPELEMVDSLFYDEGCLRACTWHEYKFVAKDGLDQEFFKRLDQACESDPTHWNSHLNTEYAIGPGFELDYDNEHVEYYSYRIYPDQTPVDRSRGMCDRMVKGHDGELTKDWDGSFISVKVQKDTIILRDGWLR
jgi:hypothetical protein